MRRIAALEQQIRRYVNDADLYERHFKNNLDEWIALCVAMDTLGDSCLALEYYEDFGIGKEYGEKYLKLYGLLQAIFLQQDSIRQLYRTFLQSGLQPSDGSAWMEIRDLRNAAVGHPIEKRDKAEAKRCFFRCFIPRIAISSNRLQLLAWHSGREQYDSSDVDLKSLYERYKSEAVEHLEGIHQAQIRKWGILQEH